MLDKVILAGALIPVIFLAQQKPCRPSRHATIPAIRESTYHKARKRLLAAGWKPIRTITQRTGPDIFDGNGPLFWRKGYVEVEACSGTGVAACAFLFKDAYGNRLRVTTEGEEIARPKSYARVSGFKFVCE